VIHLVRDLTPGATDPDARVSITCDLCGVPAPGAGRSDPDDAMAARVLADFLRCRYGWSRVGRRIVCPDCAPRAKAEGGPS
jgi:hypothetical protein